MNDAAVLWRRLLEAVRRSGGAVDGRLTPAELGRQLAAAGDPRVLDFVLRFYYPRVFGQEPGSLDLDAARALVDSLERRPPPPVAGPGVSCPLCGKEGAA